jgi:hypothetical protein
LNRSNSTELLLPIPGLAATLCQKESELAVGVGKLLKADVVPSEANCRSKITAIPAELKAAM